PELAVIVDIRPDNVLQHLIYKALFHTSQNRLEYLARLTGRPLPPDAADWSSASIDTILAYLDRAPVTEASRAEATAAVEREIEGFGVRLTDAQRATIERFHGAFIAAGPALRFRSHGRAPQFYYPTYAELLREVDREGRLVSYVSTEARWRGVRELQLADRVIPIVGDLSGDVALAAVADLLEREDLEVSAFYTSNVEFYLFGDRTFGRFVENLRRLPLAEPSVLIKSFFRGFRGAHPLQEPGYYSTQLVQSATDLVEGWDEGRYRTYREVVSDGLVGVSTPATGPTPASSVPP
ncbi:MAG: hypothetical protein MJB57_07960, partial [Gemmatimonadetes bacterium]|nr:hypothetical protein [Gemmatimonadota bacterium]